MTLLRLGDDKTNMIYLASPHYKIPASHVGTFLFNPNGSA